MLTAALLALTLPQKPAKQAWFGPATATFHVDFLGNPFDPAVNDVRVKFKSAKGDTFERLAYYDGNGNWKAVLVTPIAGSYQATLFRNGKQANAPSEEGTLQVTEPLKLGFIEVDPVAKNRFRRDTGQSYYPIGFNLGWQSGNYIPMTDQIAKMGKNGINWTRIWACAWDRKNPWWPQGDDTVEEAHLWTPAFEKWDALVEACDKNDVAFQFVLFHHGTFSTKTDSNWGDHPWNAAKGGFLKNAADFFTNAEAKRRSKMWIRYAIARYGASPQVMSWELFNEVQWVDAVVQNRWNDVNAWHKEMADYIRGLDPYNHLVTTSSVMEPAGLWTSMDYVQPHTYPANIVAAIGGEAMPKDKPGFFGEFGPGGQGTDPHRVVRDGVYAGMLANHAGAGQYWYWDIVEPKNLYPDFAAAAKVAEVSDIAAHPNARPLNLSVKTSGMADLTFAPGGGWGQLKRSKINLPADLSGKAPSEVPEYFQGTGHRDMFPEPLTLSFNAAQAGTLRMAVSTVAQKGALVKISVNGKQVVEKVYEAQAKNYPGGVLEAPFPAGVVTIQIANDGADWVQVQSLTLTNAGPQANAIGLGESDWAVVRVAHAAGAKGTVTATIDALSLSPGEYSVTTIDATSGESKTETKTIRDFRISDWSFPSADTVLVFKRKK